METSNKHNQNEYSYLRRLPIDKLLELLALAPSLSDRPEDEAYVDALEEAIIEKENENPTGFFPDVDQQWEQFVAHYLPETDQAASEPEPAEHAISPQTTRHVPQKRVIQLRQAGRTILVAAAAIVCALAIMVTAQAAGVDVFGVMARWTEDVFSFGPIAPDSQVFDDPVQETVRPEVQIPDAGFASLQEAFDATTGAAQAMADRLVRCGVGGIWNFTNYEISAPEQVVVESVHFSDSLLALSYMITQRERSGEDA